MEQRRETHPGVPEPHEEGFVSNVKLEIIQDNKLAGFIPKTHREKTQVLTLLSNVHPHKTDMIMSARAVQEIYIHQKNNKSEETAKASLQSVVYEWGDYLDNSLTSLENLNFLQEIIGNSFNPRIPLTEEVDEANKSKKENSEDQLVTINPNKAYRTLVRYMDLSNIIQSSKDETLEPDLDFNPLHVYVTRTTVGYGKKNKEIRDEYTSIAVKQEVDSHVINVINSLKIGDCRQIIKDAVKDEEKRATFWHNRIQELYWDHGVVKSQAREVLEGLDIKVEQKRPKYLSKTK